MKRNSGTSGGTENIATGGEDELEGEEVAKKIFQSLQGMKNFFLNSGGGANAGGNDIVERTRAI